ncbi:MAG: hypothetical protein P4M06_24390, partial [Pandoraea sp.]
PTSRVKAVRPKPDADRPPPIGEREARDAEPRKSEGVGAAGAGESPASALLPPSGRASDLPPLVDEWVYLRGYEQQLPAEQLPASASSRVVLINGHHYLKGAAGYYRAQRGTSADHWLIDPPQGSESRAQVPVTYDVSSGTWHAHAPLRLCGGGCGPSHISHPPDSIANSFENIFDAVRHVPNGSAQVAIQKAFSDLSKLHLRRTNRADLQTIRDNSIISHRAAMREEMRKQIDPNAPLIKQQRTASAITAMYYRWNTAAEAFCQENAEILFHSLLENGISRNQIRMITIKPQNRPPHVMVLYTESEHFIDLMDNSTPQPPHPLYRDGIGHGLFLQGVYLARRSTVLLDPWSRTKALSFASATTPLDADRIVNRALNDIGHMPGNAYTVSVTRPLGMHRANPGALRGRTGSANSDQSESASGHSAWSTLSRDGSLSSDDAAPSPAADSASSR